VGRVLGQALFLDLPLDAVTSDRIEAVDEQDTVEVIHLVLEDAALKAATEDAHRPSFEILRFDTYPRRTRHLGEDSGNRQAAFLGGCFTALLDDRRIDEG